MSVSYDYTVVRSLSLPPHGKSIHIANVYRNNFALFQQACSSSLEISVDLSLPLGFSLKSDASIDSVKPAGQLSGTVAAPGDRIVRLGVHEVSSLDEFKGAIAKQKEKGDLKVNIFIEHRSEVSIKPSGDAEFISVTRKL